MLFEDRPSLPCLEDRIESKHPLVFDPKNDVSVTLDELERASGIEWDDHVFGAEISTVPYPMDQVRSKHLPQNTHPFLMEQSGVREANLAHEFYDRVATIAPCLLTGYARQNGVHTIFESYLVDDDIGIVDGLYAGRHKGGNSVRNYPVEINIIENIAVAHYSGTTLPPSKNAYYTGRKTAKFIDGLDFSRDMFSILELGVGAGVISASLAKNIQRVPFHITGTDISGDCLMAAETTRDINEISPAVLQFKKGDWYDAVPYQKFHMIISNPPYHPSFVAQNPYGMEKYHHLADPTALDGGADGLDFYRRTLEGHDKLLPGGYFVFQVSPRSTAAVRDLAQTILGPRYKSSTVFSQNKEKSQPEARGFMVMVETH